MKLSSLLRIRNVHPSTLAPPRENQATVSRRRSADVPALRDNVLGVRFQSFPSLPAAVWNRVVIALADAVQNVMGALDSAYRAGIEDKLLQLIQEDIPSQVYQLGAAMIEEVLAEQRGFMGTTINCEHCCGHLEFEGYKPRKVTTSLGEVNLSRAYYHGSCCHSAFPLDRLLGVEEHALLPAVQQTVALLASRMPYAEAVETLQRMLPVRLSNHTALQVTATVTNEMREHRDKLKPSVDRPATVAVAAVDGGMYRTRDKAEPFKEVKMGVLGTLEPVPGKHEQIDDKHYVCTLGDADDLFTSLVSSYYRTGLQHADTLVALGDGAPWIWNRMRTLLGPGQEFIPVLDFYHASERLRELSQVVFGEDSEDGKAWWEKMKTMLKESKLSSFFKQFTRLLKTHGADPKKSESITGQRNYFKQRQDYIDYAECLRRGFPIGSGIIEGGIRFIAKDRLHRTGMRWSPEGAADILLLRCIDASQEWDQMTEFLDKKRLGQYKASKTTWLTAA